MSEKKYARVKVTADLRQKIDALKNYAVCRTDDEALVFAIQSAYHELIGRYEK